MLINDKVDAVFIPDSPSRIKATDYNQIKNEIQECITEAGLTPTKDVIQLPQALKILTAQSGAEEVAKIEAAGQEQTSAINSTGAMQVESINTAGSSQVNKVNDAGNTQKAMLENTGKTQVTAVRSAGTDTVTQVEQAGIDAAQLAKDWANKTDGAVAEGEYSAKKYAQEAAQSASTINPSTYVPKAGGTMTGPLKLPAPAAGLNDNTAITAAWARALITGKTVVKDYITERFSDENGNWYEVYASGWIRQGGTKTATSEGDVITFLKPFASTNYKFWSSCKTGNNDNTTRTFAEVLNYPRTNTSIHIKSLPYFPQTQGDWFAEGQGSI